jgi:parallel beta-helix repeat protein
MISADRGKDESENGNPIVSSKGIKLFISYSHKDDELRTELEKHLSALNHQGLVSAWHDRKIGAGEDWREVIDEHLNVSQIILLLISSDFLASKYCIEEEMKRAMERHQSGEARVIPIILRHVNWDGLPFSDLQALPTNAEPVKDGNWKSSDAAFKDVVEGLKKVIQDFDHMPDNLTPIINPNPNNKNPRTITVDQMNRGDYTKISDAIYSANSGDIIFVRPGLYEEGIEINKPLEIVGDGEIADIVIRASGVHALAFRAPTGRVANLTLRHIGGSEFCCVDISKGRLILEDCDISGQGRYCISIHDSADPRLRRNKIHNCSGIGVIVTENGQGLLEDNDIFENSGANVEINKNSHPILRANRIHDGKLTGIYLNGSAQGILENNDIFGHEKSQVFITTNSNPTLRGNRIHDGKLIGVYLNGNAQGILENNDIFGHERTQVFITGGCNPTLKSNRIYDGKANGIVITDSSHGFFDENDIHGHSSVQIVIMKGSNPIFRHNHIHSCESYGIYVLKKGRGLFKENDLRGNKLGAWIIKKSCESKVKRISNLE